jgi:hypothetical protein
MFFFYLGIKKTFYLTTTFNSFTHIKNIQISFVGM